VGGRDIHIKTLTDLQMLHLLRHAKILQKDDIDKEQKIESADRMFAILNTIVTEPDDQAYLTKMEEEGKVELKDLLSFVNAADEDPEQPEKPKVRRGRPRKTVAA
jgi:hypothetical protein